VFFVPLGVKAWFLGHGMQNVVELDWWESATHGGLAFHLVPVQHWSARTPWDRDRTLWGGWIVEHPRAAARSRLSSGSGGIAQASKALDTPEFRFFFAGDTGYSLDFKDIAARFSPIDLAAIPIGGYEPRWFMSIMHVNPEEAVKIHQDLRARQSVGMHWGTFILTDEPLDEPPHRLASARRTAGVSPENFFLMKHGETCRLAPMMRLVADRAEAAEPVS
jgi:L-ascorbate metabolism protein UlaG (beta-lactamase superfamily)